MTCRIHRNLQWDWRWSLLFIAAVAVALLGMFAYAFAHDAPAGWAYDNDCCGSHDCHPINCDELTDESNGWHWRPNGRDIVFNHGNGIRISKDQTCHACHQWTGGHPINPGRCLYIRATS